MEKDKGSQKNVPSCPFAHHTKEFQVFPDSNTFWCGECAIGGDTIAYITNIHAMPFSVAVYMARIEQ
ncbi:MAG: CHC2 zinc finger domain-containing protein [Patescibacteria group bacterium]